MFIKLKLVSALLFLSPFLTQADVIAIDWLSKTESLKKQQGDVIDIVTPISSKQINRNYEESTDLDKEPFPKGPSNPTPFFKSEQSLDSNLSLKSFNVFTNETEKNTNLSSKPVSKKQIKKSYKYKYVTNKLTNVVAKKCHPYYLKTQLESANSLDEFEKTNQQFFKKCDKKLVNSFRNKYIDLAKLSLKRYKVFQNKNTHPFKLEFDNNESLEGFLALKPNRTRPLIIVKCGVFCSGKSSTTNNMIISSLYDSGPFHVMLIANHTGSRNVRDNNRVNIGGFIEGQEIIKVAKWAKNESYFKNYISEVHVLGISLGGHGALYSGIFNDHLDEKIINSVIGFCPVTNVKNSVYDVTARGIIGSIVSRVVQNLIKDNYDNIPYLRNYIDLSKHQDKKKLSKQLAQINVEYLNLIDNREFLPPFTNTKFSSIDDYFYFNDFEIHSDQLQTPTLILASKNDPVVRFKNNTRLLTNKKHDNLKFVNLKKGSHCATHESYGWYTMSKILNQFFINHSPSLNYEDPIGQSSFDFKQPYLLSYEKYADIRFLTFTNLDKLIVEYKIFRGQPYQDPFYASQKDFRFSTIEIDFSDLPFQLKVPESRVEAQILTRWLNTNVHLKEDNQLFHLTRNPANFIEWSKLLP